MVGVSGGGSGQSGAVNSSGSKVTAGLCSLQPNQGAASMCLLCRRAEAVPGNAHLGMATGRGFHTPLSSHPMWLFSNDPHPWGLVPGA